MATPISHKRSLTTDQEDSSKKVKLEVDRKSKGIQEVDVGITKYLNDSNSGSGGFFGTIKQRYSDFLVNEIDTNGKVVHLTDEGIDMGKSKKERNLEKRQSERAELQNKTPEEVEQIKDLKKAEEENKPKYELSEENKTKLLELITAEELAQIEELFSTGNNMETKTTFPEKQTRGKLHQLLREGFQGKLDSLTSPENTFRVALAKNSSNPRRRNPQESINHVDENGVVNYGLGAFKNYLHFTVYKENRETMEIASTISKFLRIPSKSIRYGGTKDRRGVTCQRFSIQKGKVARVSSLNKGLKGSVLGGFTYEDKPLSLGELEGNEFVITIRDAKTLNESDKLEEVVEQCFESLQGKGYINYYGMQRFGTFSISTHVLGIKILQEDWKGTVELILSEQDIVTPDSIEARRVWAETHDPSLTIRKMPRRCTAEHSILSTLEREKVNEDGDYSSNSYFKSIMAIPRNLRIMYAHAYQSYVWNQVTSKRIEMFGLEVQVGDLVIAEKTEEESNLDDVDDFQEDIAVDKFVRAKALTKEDVESGKYSIYDIVLPMPGFDILYPTNEELSQVYVDVMKKDGLDPHNMARKVREFSLAGSYRKIVCKPESLSYELVKYTDDFQPLVRTDLELLRMKKEAESKGEEYVEKRTIDAVIEEGKPEKTAVVLKIQLGVSSYATMALREFMKADTSRLSDNLNVREDK
ncbi:multisubstrate pseudouridine synthase 7 [[Candida] anglica]|uniref:Multisubstrate pseudouridine synthase 7 n=1 Tax=[Candida] anglica TaxID=148631 RepID=A0ABP0EJS8_9ASCO